MGGGPVYALYTASHRLLYSLVPAFAAQILVMTAALSVSLPDVMPTAACAAVVFPVRIIAYRSGMFPARAHGCSRAARLCSLASITFEGVLFALTLYKYCVARHEGWAGAGLVTILVRDGVWAFALIFRASPAGPVAPCARSSDVLTAA